MRRAALVVWIGLCVVAATPLSAVAQISDSVSVDRTVAAAMQGLYEIRETVRLAAEGCASGPDSWQRQVAEQLVARPPESIPDQALAVIIPPMSIGMHRCMGLDVTGWIRSALYKKMDPRSYRELARGLGDGVVGHDVLQNVAADPEADQMHRLWVTEALVASQPMRSQIVGPGGITDRIAEHYRFNGLAPDYARAWLPMLLAAPQTREGAARDLMRSVARAPSHMGAPEILLIVAADVEAYDYRFSIETRSIVSNFLEEMKANRSELPFGVALALDSATAARAAKRNHRGVRVQRQPLQLVLSSTASGCVVVGRPVVVEAVAAVAPGFRLSGNPECRLNDVTHADFDGDGAEDALLRGTTGDRTVLLAILTGSVPRVHIISTLGESDSARIQGPGTYEPSCDSPGPFVFENDWIIFNHNDSSSTNFRFTGSTFEALLGDTC